MIEYNILNPYKQQSIFIASADAVSFEWWAKGPPDCVFT